MISMNLSNTMLKEATQKRNTVSSAINMMYMFLKITTLCKIMQLKL